MRRRVPLAEHETARTAGARGLLRAGVDEASGEPQAVSVLTERVGWAVALATGMATKLLAAHWNSADVAVLASGKDGEGRKLPPNAWMAMRRLGWTGEPPEGVRVNDRILRMAQEQAGRTLRSARWRAELVAGVLRSWPADPARRTADEWVQVRAAVPAGRHLSSSVIKGHTRQLAAFLKANGRLPADVFELEGVPRAARMLLSACDGQQACIERAGGPDRALLRLRLPTRPDPRSCQDWTWVACPIVLPPTIPSRALLHLPTLRLDRGRVRIDLAYTHAVPRAARTGHTVALGVADEIRRVGARRSNLNAALAWAAARWAVDQAVTAGAGVIYLEDLRSMEARGMGRTHNTRVAQTARGQISDRMWHLAAEAGIAVVTVPARNTSRHCPQCLVPLLHRKAPDAPTVPGWKWALCPGCGWQGDRDQGAWQRIAARGLAHQARTATDRVTGVMAVHTVVDELEARAVSTPAATRKTCRADRSKIGPTRLRPTRPVPRRRRTPSPAGRSRPAGQRPEGHAHTDRFRLPRAAGRNQGVTTISPPPPGPRRGERAADRHRPRGAALGAGFHLHAHATPPRREHVRAPDTPVRRGIILPI
ncbi:transposase IS605 OrfB [Actinobacteria bacterium OV450]|nr:transposase IS605 OrfB [Actinobacteria bacterium OV450]